MKSKQLQELDPEVLCALLAMPGDFILSHMSGSSLGKAAYQPFLVLIMILELLDLNDPITKYFHAEIITEIDPAMKMKAQGFYPFIKRYLPNKFKDNYALYRVRGSPDEQEEALQKLRLQKYHHWGVCSDYLAWAYDHKIYSWWNVIPLLRDILVRIYPPEAIHTSDDLANSPQTVKICEVKNGVLVYPPLIYTDLLLNHLKKCAGSTNKVIQQHSVRVKNLLVQQGFIDQADQVLITEIILR
ncbi:hypothetical protein ACFL27_02485 [candidate division CSSED10-310 bacterium]|uniref:Uncharacterized protein n=1 Tax=candidate division CSSED10-310 bacterium TaxID=2855610 RepID=A0ABV6YS81_UNCC1